jgi:hypothetical protein
MASIFIQIPAYRDFELPKTIANAINKASGNHFLFFGVHNCVLFDNEIHIPEFDYDHVEVGVSTSIAPENLGLQRSRQIANSYYDGQEYYFQVDSHMRFAENWDESLISMMHHYFALGVSRPLITMYPASYTYLDDGTEKLSPEKFEKYVNVSRIWLGESPDKFSADLIPTQTAVAIDEFCGYTASVSGGFIFTLGSFANIRPNHKITFWGEEPLIAARAFTHGFDLVTPLYETAWHLYHSAQPFSKARRYHVWQDFPELWADMDGSSKAEYFNIMKNGIIGDLELGSERTLTEYEEFAGLDFKNQVVTQIKMV